MVALSQALRETMFRYDLVGAKLAEDANITPSQITSLRKGKSVNTQTFEKILGAMPVEARKYLLTLLCDDDRQAS